MSKIEVQIVLQLRIKRSWGRLVKSGVGDCREMYSVASGAEDPVVGCTQECRSTLAYYVDALIYLPEIHGSAWLLLTIGVVASYQGLAFVFTSRGHAVVAPSYVHM